MAMKKTSGGDSPLRQGAGKTFWTLPIFGSTAAVDHDVFWKSDRVLRFFHRGVFIGEGAMSEEGPGGLMLGWRGPGPGPGRPSPVCGAPMAPSYFSSDLWKLLDKIRLQELVSSNSENISCVSLLKHKNSRKMRTGTVATC
jgi:hypothetical protein